MYYHILRYGGLRLQYINFERDTIQLITGSIGVKESIDKVGSKPKKWIKGQSHKQ